MIGLLSIVYNGEVVAQTDERDNADLIVRLLDGTNTSSARWEFSESQGAMEFFVRTAVNAGYMGKGLDAECLIRIGHYLFSERVPSINDVGEVWCGDDYLGKVAEKTISFDTDFPNS